ncbi:MAG: hypothetical protein H9847_04290 [Candidatus Anaerobiospirillum pullicola]|uniref:Uncharacterized protein n=1 Tax=Candidatus Anaerobiospirillum pullicola TaxID=2838451 RepID=A0A948WZ09_9GAMM|nr:hypothetical protein [Candidatus Anaerobiospirillum pullicola]
MHDNNLRFVQQKQHIIEQLTAFCQRPRFFAQIMSMLLYRSPILHLQEPSSALDAFAHQDAITVVDAIFDCIKRNILITPPTSAGAIASIPST